MALVNHVLCSKDFEIIALVLLHFWNKVMLEKVEDDVAAVVSRNNESEVTQKKKTTVLGSFTVKVSYVKTWDFYRSFLPSLARLLSWFSPVGLLEPKKSI